MPTPLPLDPWRGLPRDAWQARDPAALQRDYSPSSMVESLDAELRAYADGSAAARAMLPFRTHAYGEGPDELVDVVPARQPGSPLHVYIHGGYWQQLSRHDSSFMAVPLAETGVAFAAVGYTLAPAASLGQIVDQCARAVAWCRDHAAELDADPSRVVLSGSSAGAHLAAMVLTRLAGIAGAVLLSGIYDLAPIRRTTVNDALWLDDDDVRSLSPLSLRPLGPTPLVVAVGEVETAEFHRQSTALADAWRAAGCPVEELLVFGRHHFDLPGDLGDISSALGRAVHRLTFGTPSQP